MKASPSGAVDVTNINTLVNCIYPNIRKFWVQKKYLNYAYEEELSGGKRLPRVGVDLEEKVAPSCPQKALSDAIPHLSEIDQKGT
jgi:hypothetical protein